MPPGCRGARGRLTPLSRWQVAFTALRDGFLGDMALDDVVLTAEPCGAQPACSFEADACGLAASGQRTWLRQSNGTGTAAGPPADHTTGTAAGTGATVVWGSGEPCALAARPVPSLPCALPYPLPAMCSGHSCMGVPTPGAPKPQIL